MILPKIIYMCIYVYKNFENGGGEFEGRWSEITNFQLYDK